MNHPKFIYAVIILFLLTNAAYTQTDIIPVGSSIKKLSSNQFSFIEGPLWYRDSVLLFTDLGSSPTKIYRYDPIQKTFGIFRNNSESTNGLTCDREGNLLGCEGSKNRVIMMSHSGAVVKALASTYQNKPFNSPNDLIADAKGGVYFTDPLFGSTPMQDKEGVYYVDSVGVVTRIISELPKPNGVILSPDGTKLYVVDTYNKYLYRWDVASDGSVSNKLELATLQTISGIESMADGMAVDINGNIYIASAKGIQVFSPSGVALTVIAVPETPTNCDFGGSDFKTLYITANKNLYAIQLNFPGFALSRKSKPNGITAKSRQCFFQIFPNPVHGVLSFKSFTNRQCFLRIFDLKGSLVFENNRILSDDTVPTDNLPNGTYFFNIYDSESNRSIQQQTIIVRH